MSCVDCHNPHGSTRPAMTQTFAANEPGCFNCHGDKRGPFTFEHAPVRFEGCATCHEPHGSANPRMLARQDLRSPVPGVPRQSAGGEHHGHDRSCAAVVPRSAFADATRTARCAIRRSTEVTWIGTCSDETLADLWRFCSRCPRTRSHSRPRRPRRRPHRTRTLRSPVPTPESLSTGSIDVGYRWVSDTGGSFDTYRSFVNLGSGPKLLGTDFSLADPRHRPFRPDPGAGE